jgi:hypothetical protein
MPIVAAAVAKGLFRRGGSGHFFFDGLGNLRHHALQRMRCKVSYFSSSFGTFSLVSGISS